MAGEPAWLYPSRPVDRSLRARVGRTIARRTEGLRRRVPPLGRVVRELGAVTGKSTLAIGADVLSAWLADGIDPRRFAGYMLWEVPRDERRDFVSAVDLDPFFAATTDRDDRQLMLDKAGFAEHGRRSGIPCPSTLAVINRRAGAPIADVLDWPDESGFAEAVERLSASGDVFLKPAVGKQGIGVYRVSRGGLASDADGRAVSLPNLAERVFAYRHPAGPYGYLAQPLIESHPEIVELTGVTELSTLRVITAVRDGVAQTMRAFLKISAPGRLTNNFRGGSSGSLLTALDPESGRLDDLVGILRSENHFAIERTATHPVSGRRVAGEELPCWQEALDVARRGALLHSRTATLGWDIALSPTGWKVLEVNTSWGPGGPQASMRSGLKPDLVRLFPEYFR